MEIFLLITRLFLFGIFAVAGIAKLFDLRGSEKAVRDFGVHEKLSKPIGLTLPIVEIILAFSLLFSSFSWFGAIGVLFLLLAFIVGMIIQIQKGNAPDCHCFGQLKSEPVGQKSLIRNVLFACLALILVAQGRENQGLSAVSWVSELSTGEKMQFFGGLIIIGLLSAVVVLLKNMLQQQKQLVRKIEILELVSAENLTENVQRENVTHPMEGLPIGTPVPDFSVPDVKGRNVEFEHLLMKTKPLLFFFVGTNCKPCEALLPQIKTWAQELQNKLEIILVSSGTAKENEAKFGQDLMLLIQKDKEIAEIFQAVWTPTCILVSDEGNIASRLAAGDSAIKDFIEMLKSQEKIDFVVNENGGGQDTPKIGEKIPEFNLPDISGQNVKSQDLIGKKTVITFWDNECPYCEKMIEEIREWEKNKSPEEANLMLFAEGQEEASQALKLQTRIVLDENRIISTKLGMYGTPSAVLINENGVIASETAFGSRQIWSLIGKSKK